MKEYTYIMIKPDGVKKGLTEEIIKRIHSKGYEIKLFDVRKLTGEILDEHYAHVADRPFYPGMKQHMMSDYVVPMIVYGENAIQGMRDLMGPTKPAEAPAGTIRGDYGNKDNSSENVIHGSDSQENALIEIKRFFGLDLTHGEEYTFTK
jgi:nucleoside-diphosphate kinase